MRLKIAADIHGAFEELAARLEPNDTAVLLGDFINILDYNDFSGVLSQVVDLATIVETLRLIQEKRLAEAKAIMAKTASGIDRMYEKVGALADESYKDLFASLPCPCYLINGNVDFPVLIEKNLRPPAVYFKEFRAMDLDGRRVGFVSGHPHMTYSFGMPGEVTPEEYRHRLDALGPVDHLFVHPPPAVPDLSFDDKAKRDEGGSDALLSYIEIHRPLTVHFGHVHTPVRSEMTLGSTRLINVGCFRDEKRVAILEW